MRNPIAPLALLVAFVPGCLEEPEQDSFDPQADSAALDALEEPDEIDAELHDDGAIIEEDDDDVDVDADIDELTSEPDAMNACVNCYSNFYTSFHSAGCFYARCYPGDLDLGCSGGFRSCYEQICFPQSASGSIDASPEVVPISGSTGTTRISWSGCANTNQVWVSHNGAPETLFAQDPSGNQYAPWIQVGQTYDFCLYEGTSHTNQLDCVTVTGQYQAPPASCFETGCPFGKHCCGDLCVPNGNECP